MTRGADLFRRIQVEKLNSIDKLIEDVTAEELFLDFKTSADNRVSRTLAEGDAKTLAKAISGFGNSEGGVVVWGVDRRADRDGNQQIKRTPLIDALGFRANIESAISRLTLPVHPTVESIHIPIDNSASGYVATYIPKATVAPIRSIAKGVDGYYIRAGDSFVPTPHSVLQYQFGRQPIGVIWVQFYGELLVKAGTHCSIALGIGCANGGTTLIEHAYLSAHPANLQTSALLSLQSASPGVNIEDSRTGNWQAHAPAGRVIAPGGVLDLAMVYVHVPIQGAGIEDDVVVDCVVGAANTVPQRFTIKCPRRVINNAVASVANDGARIMSSDLYATDSHADGLRDESMKILVR